jgi:shikimate dehydrogenase
VIPMTSDAIISYRDRINLIVNTTPVGMSPNVEFSPWPEGAAFPVAASVYDLIYNPRETLLVKHARMSGLRATTGLGMLVEQAALGFKIWTGCEPSRNVMLSSLEE